MTMVQCVSVSDQDTRFTAQAGHCYLHLKVTIIKLKTKVVFLDDEKQKPLTAVTTRLQTSK